MKIITGIAWIRPLMALMDCLMWICFIIDINMLWAEAQFAVHVYWFEWNQFVQSQRNPIYRFLSICYSSKYSSIRTNYAQFFRSFYLRAKMIYDRKNLVCEIAAPVECFEVLMTISSFEIFRFNQIPSISASINYHSFASITSTLKGQKPLHKWRVSDTLVWKRYTIKSESTGKWPAQMNGIRQSFFSVENFTRWKAIYHLLSGYKSGGRSFVAARYFFLSLASGHFVIKTNKYLKITAACLCNGRKHSIECIIKLIRVFSFN